MSANRPGTKEIVNFAAWVAAYLVFAVPALAHDFGEAAVGQSEELPKSEPALPCDENSCCPAAGSNGNSTGEASQATTTNADGTGSTNVCGKGGDPVDGFTGRFTHTQVDLVVDGVYPIRFVRRYDSQSEYDSPLGYGWTHGYDVRLFEYTDGSFVVRTRDGVRIHYESTYDHANKGRGRAPMLSEEPGAGTFTLRYPNGEQQFFDAEGRLTAQQDPQGNRLEMSYTPDPLLDPVKMPLMGRSPYAVDPAATLMVAELYQLTKIEERTKDGTKTGRQLEFQYDSATGRLTTVESDDGRQVKFFQTSDVETEDRGDLARVEGLEGIDSNYLYDSDHNLTQFEDALGETPTVNVYDASDRVMTQTRGDRSWAFDYDAQPNITTVTRTIKVGETQKFAITDFTFDAFGQLIQKVDALGNRIDYNRAVPDRHFLTQVVVQRNDGGTRANPSLVSEKTIDLTYFPDGNLETRSATIGAGTLTESWTYDSDWVSSYQRVWDIEPTKVFKTEYTFEYDTGGLPTNVIEIKRKISMGVFETTTLDYDDDTGQLSSITPPALTPNDGFKIVRTYYPTNTMNGNAGLLHEAYIEFPEDPGPANQDYLARTLVYDSKSHPVSVTDARDNTTSFGYDALRRLTTLTNPDDETAVLTYTGPNDGGADLENPANWTPGRLLARIETGQTMAEGEGQIRRLIYDALGRLIRVERKDDADNISTFAEHEYDSDNNRTLFRDGVLRETLFDYDELLRLTSLIDADTNETTFGYDAVGNRTRVTQADGDLIETTTLFAYDALNRLTQANQQGESAITQFGYDAAGNVTSVIDPNQVGEIPPKKTVYAYDTLSRLQSVTQPEGETVSYCYDPRGRLDRVINARLQGLEYTYLPWSGLEQVEHFDTATTCAAALSNSSRTVAYTYDESANLLTTTETYEGQSSELLYTYTYDDLDRVDTTIADFLSGAPKLDSGYDRFGNRNLLEVTEGALTSSYAWTYNDLDRLRTIDLPGVPVSNYITYLGNDDLNTWPHSNGLTTSYTYAAAGPVQTITVNDPSQLHQLTYTLDEVLNVKTLVEQIDTDPAETYTYGYDGLYRLTSSNYPAAYGLPADETFDYDDAGNREDTGYAHDDDNQIQTSPGKGYVFDADGNLTEINDGVTPTPNPLRTFAWDTTNRLTTTTDELTSEVTTYRYDPFGRRIGKTVAGVTTQFLWDGDQLFGEYDASGNRLVRYAYAGGFAPVQVFFGPGSECNDGLDNDGDTLTDFVGGDPDCEDANDPSEGTELEVHTDHLDTPRMLTDASGQVVWYAAYEAFGQAHVDSDPDGDTNDVAFNIRFPGQYYDVETGLHYNRFRYYDPNIGRYISADPIGQAGDFNIYRYARNDPANIVDPTGLDVDIVITRSGTTSNSQAGTFTATSSVAGDSISGHTLEDPNPPNPNLPAPPGSYSAHVDSRAGRSDRIELDHVPDASYVQIHSGNTAADVEGCFVVG